MAGLVGLVNVVEGRGGIRYLQAYFHKDPNANIDAAGVAREALLESLPLPPVRPIVFLGDSLTAGGEWWELFGHRGMILNRGIGGDTSAGVLKRISTISRMHPEVVFLMIGTNDGQLLGYAPADTLRNYRMILSAIRQASPGTRIYIESVLPSRAPKFNRWSQELNASTRQLADGKTVFFIDIRNAFLDSNGLLDERYTLDGLHLNANGYAVWKRQLDPIMDQLTTAS